MLINGEEHNELCVGIDLGTTNSVLAVVNLRHNGDIVSKVIEVERAVDMYSGADGKAKLTTRKEPTLPSCVYYNEENNFSPIVGNFARSRYSLRPHLVAKSIKSQMDLPFAQGLSPDIPDKTPAQISSRILQHILINAARTFRQREITDAVITIPANFDIGWQPTLEAAELAGIKIRNKDGSLRPILLSEPEAVIYDFMNQVHNGEISNNLLDLNTPKNVMVFDLGGGTLDVTLHKISRRKDIPELLDKEPLAINRYTLLGGDDFDSALAEIMFTHYLEQYRANPEIVQRIKRERLAVMPQLLNYAEELKIRISMAKSNVFGNFNQTSDAWGDEEDTFNVGGKIGATGYAYDDNFTTEDLENIWSRFMGNGLKFDDFKNIDAVAQKFGTSNIIYPVLDVLEKTSKKLGTQDFKVDAVIMNGGMSRFYMVVDRLKDFFGFEPIIALDPDQAVARGAAVYHYYLHRYAGQISYEEKPAKISKVDKPQTVKTETAPPPIKLVTTILPDSLYLLTQGNRYEEIIKTGTTLPHESKLFTGFKLPSATNKISIPIARQNPDKSYSVIAKGNMFFPEKYSFATGDNFVAFTVSMNEQRIITMNANICRDAQGEIILDKGTSQIAISKNIETAAEISPAENKVAPLKVTPAIPVGTGTPIKLNEALNNLLRFCKNFEIAQRRGNGADASKNATLIRREKQNIVLASNAPTFGDLFFRFINNATGLTETFKMHCVIIGRKIGNYWTDAQRRRLANFCMEQLQREIHFPDFQLRGNAVNTKIQAIYTLYMCGSKDDLAQLQNLHGYTQFHIALLYTYAMTKTNVDWLYEKFQRDYRRVLDGNTKSGIQNTIHALGVAFRLGDGVPTKSSVKREKVVSELCGVIRSKNLNYIEMGRCFVALGLLCDCRYENELAPKYLSEAQKVIEDIDKIYDFNFVDRFRKFIEIAAKMMQGVQLSAAEEEFLLIKIDD